jgi:CRP-like cAMP-binding protein
MRGLRTEKRAVPDLLHGMPLFAGCTRRELSRFASLADEVRVDAGEVLAREGAPGRRCYVVVEGWAEVTRAGRRLGSVGPGAVAGDITFADSSTTAVTVTGATPMRLLMLDPETLSSLRARAPRVAERIRRAASEEQPRMGPPPPEGPGRLPTGPLYPGGRPRRTMGP